MPFKYDIFVLILRLLKMSSSGDRLIHRIVPLSISSCALYMCILISVCIIMICLKTNSIIFYRYTTGINKDFGALEDHRLSVKTTNVKRIKAQELYLPVLTLYIDYMLNLVLHFSPFYQSH